MTKTFWTAPARDRSAAPATAAAARESFATQMKVVFCAPADVAPTRIFEDRQVRTWNSARVTGWQNRKQDIHRYMMSLPFPHEGASTVLNMGNHWSRCESDRLLEIIDKCIE